MSDNILFPVIVKFTGELADNHRLPAYAASKSLYGISRSLLLTSHYLVEGKVRQKNFKYDGYNIHLVASRQGSFESLFEVMMSTDMVAQTLSGIIGGITTASLINIYGGISKRVIGEKSPELDKLEGKEILKSGDVGALVEALEPAVKDAHNVIGDGATNITIINGSNNIITYDKSSKDYVNKSILTQYPEVKIVSVGSFNVNTDYGRIYDFELQRTIPFTLSKDVDAKTIQLLTQSLQDYANEKKLGKSEKSKIAIKFFPINAIDGRLKKIIILHARSEMSEM